LYVKDNINVSRRGDLDFDDLEGMGSNKNKWQKDLIWNFVYPIKVTKIYWGNWKPQ
jgi:hypothetical protein